jgi:hypothetical protein
MKQRGRKSAAQLATLAVVGGKSPRVVATSPPPPPDLGEPEQAIWRNVVNEYRASLTSLTVLHSALKMHARAREASEVIAEEGMVVETQRGGGRAHPLCAVEREARRSFEMSFRRLGIKL